MNIRPAASQDAEIITRLNEAVQQLHAEVWPEIFKPVSEGNGIEALFADLLAEPDNHFFLAFLDEKPVGYAWARVERREETPLKFARDLIYVHQISVNPDVQGQGIGQGLMQAIFRLTEDKQISEIALDTWAFNREARDFFSGQGFIDYNMRMWRRIDSA